MSKKFTRLVSQKRIMYRKVYIGLTVNPLTKCALEPGKE